MHRIRFFFTAACLVTTLTTSLSAHADNTCPATIEQQLSLSADAQREIDNDLMTASLYIEVSDKDPVRLADRINLVINEAIKRSKSFPAVKIRNTGNSTQPLYDQKNRLDGWRARAEIELESRDFAVTGKLIGQLQNTLQLASVRFGVAPETRDTAQNALIAEAVAAFRKRADAATQAFGLKNWKVQQSSINTGDNRPPMPMYKTMAMERGGMADAVAAPELSGGSSQISVNISGTVVMQ